LQPPASQAASSASQWARARGRLDAGLGVRDTCHHEELNSASKGHDDDDDDEGEILPVNKKSYFVGYLLTYLLTYLPKWDLALTGKQGK
jgi:hypothetical protein